MKASNYFNKKSLLVALVAAIGTMSSASVFAVTESGTMTVSATLIGGCTVSDSALEFGDNISALLSEGDVMADTGTSLNIACSSGTTPMIYSATPRILEGEGIAALGSIAFNLSQTAGAESDDLPVTDAGQTILSGFEANGDEQVVTIYGRIPAVNFGNQPVGPYAATIVMSVEY